MRHIRVDFVAIRQDSSFPVPLSSIHVRVRLHQAPGEAYDLGTHVSDAEGRILVAAPERSDSGRRELVDIIVERTPYSSNCIAKIDDEKVWNPMPGSITVEALPVIRVHLTQLSQS